jgi:hypothetical protein
MSFSSPSSLGTFDFFSFVFLQGAYFHVVVGMQMGVELVGSDTVLACLYTESLVENTAFAIVHHEDKAHKYLRRILDAHTRLGYHLEKLKLLEAIPNPESSTSMHEDEQLTKKTAENVKGVTSEAIWLSDVPIVVKVFEAFSDFKSTIAASAVSDSGSGAHLKGLLKNFFSSLLRKSSKNFIDIGPGL